LGDGLSPLFPGEVDVVVIAGMGGETIIKILSEDRDKTRSFRKYILQPRTKTDQLRGWLKENDWIINAETAVDEKWRRCDIIICAPEDADKKY
jgi:tRNA (adenine22-N1)-methyltransferase